jgi:amino acid adenylation domain-containing protein
MLDRSADLIIALLGVLKSGSAYVVIEPEWPVARKKYILQDTASAVLITESRYLFELEYYQGLVVALDIELDQLKDGEENAAEKPAASDLAYIVYTSGTTGSPKGVQIHHRSLTDYVSGLLTRTNLRECRRFGLVSGVSADLGYTVLYGSLSSGGSLHIFTPVEAMDPTVLRAAALDCIKIVPTHWKALQGQGVLYAPERSLIFGGEVLGAEVIAALQEGGANCKVYNHYGPSETTVGKLIKEIDLQSKEPITLGRPFCNSQVYILDRGGSLLPVGIPGEICIGGAGVSSGYLNQSELTAEKFIADPWQSGNTLYRTGDAGRWTREGGQKR